MQTSIVSRAAYNNAIWCDMVCGTHGDKGNFYDDYWHHSGPVPRFYPQFITLRAGPAAAAAQLAAIDHEIKNGRRVGAVKDSFDALDLHPLGFRRLFIASWIARAAPAPVSLTVESHGLSWIRVTDAGELTRWETAWAGQEPDATGPALFQASLLAQPGVTVLAGYWEGRIVAGAILNRTGEEVGLSNVFTLSGDATATWRSLIAAARVESDGLPLIGYEQGDALAAALAAGFKPLHALSVWIAD